MARVRAILRRVQPREAELQNLYSVGNLVIDLDKYLVTIGGAEVTLTKKEVELLWTLAKNSSKVFSRENLLDSIWGYDYFGDSRTVDSHIKRPRPKQKSAVPLQNTASASRRFYCACSFSSKR